MYILGYEGFTKDFEIICIVLSDIGTEDVSDFSTLTISILDELMRVVELVHLDDDLVQIHLRILY